MNKEIQKLKCARKRALRLSHKISNICEEYNRKIIELEKVQSECSHNIGVVVNSYDEDFDFFCNVYCINCFQSHNEIKNNFKNLIHFEELEDKDLSDEDKINLAFKMYANMKNNNPNMSDKEIVDLINKKAKKQIREYQKNKKQNISRK